MGNDKETNSWINILKGILPHELSQPRKEQRISGTFYVTVKIDGETKSYSVNSTAFPFAVTIYYPGNVFRSIKLEIDGKGQVKRTLTGDGQP
jgi:hypothetical protein